MIVPFWLSTDDVIHRQEEGGGERGKEVVDRKQFHLLQPNQGGRHILIISSSPTTFSALVLLRARNTSNHMQALLPRREENWNY